MLANPQMGRWLYHTERFGASFPHSRYHSGSERSPRHLELQHSKCCASQLTSFICGNVHDVLMRNGQDILHRFKGPKINVCCSFCVLFILSSSSESPRSGIYHCRNRRTPCRSMEHVSVDARHLCTVIFVWRILSNR